MCKLPRSETLHKYSANDIKQEPIGAANHIKHAFASVAHNETLATSVPPLNSYLNSNLLTKLFLKEQNSTTSVERGSKLYLLCFVRLV